MRIIYAICAVALVARFISTESPGIALFSAILGVISVLAAILG